jgi:hypothetical protein
MKGRDYFVAALWRPAEKRVVRAIPKDDRRYFSEGVAQNKAGKPWVR